MPRLPEDSYEARRPSRTFTERYAGDRLGRMQGLMRNAYGPGNDYVREHDAWLASEHKRMETLRSIPQQIIDAFPTRKRLAPRREPYMPPTPLQAVDELVDFPREFFRSTYPDRTRSGGYERDTEAGGPFDQVLALMMALREAMTAGSAPPLDLTQYKGTRDAVHSYYKGKREKALESGGVDPVARFFRFDR